MQNQDQNQDQNNPAATNNLEQMPLVPHTASDESAANSEMPAPAVGLMQAREAKHLSVGDAAYALKVSPRVIEALEAGEWQKLPGRTFIVGMLRAYGRLLDMSVDAMIDSVPGATPSVRKHVADQAPRTKSLASASGRQSGEVKRQTNRMSRVGMLMVLLAVILAYAVPGDYWRLAVDEGQALYERLTTKQAPVAAADAVAPPAASEQAAPVTAQAEQQAQTSTGTLELRFAAPAWVEVRDYTGRIIFSQLNAAGSTQFITGAAPLDVMIGNAKQVQARWRDEPLKLDKLSSDDVARQILR